MTDWQRDWRDDKVDRLEKRVYAIEQGIREARLRAWTRSFYALLVVYLLLVTGAVVASIVTGNGG